MKKEIRVGEEYILRGTTVDEHYRGGHVVVTKVILSHSGEAIHEVWAVFALGYKEMERRLGGTRAFELGDDIVREMELFCEPLTKAELLKHRRRLQRVLRELA